MRFESGVRMPAGEYYVGKWIRRAGNDQSDVEACWGLRCNAALNPNVDPIGTELNSGLQVAEFDEDCSALRERLRAVAKAALGVYFRRDKSLRLIWGP